MASVGQVAVIVAQRGAGTGAQVAARGREAPTVVLMCQEPGESLGGLGQRVRARVRDLIAEGWRIQSATFVASDDFGLDDVAATGELLRAVIASMVASGSGRVHLQSRGRGTRAHFALQALAFAISDQVRGTGVEIVTSDARGDVPATAVFDPAVA